jgi:hypothetical protein
MLYLRCRVLRVLIPDHQPPIVEAAFSDARGVQHLVHDKEPIFFVQDVALDQLPLDGSIRCTRISEGRVTLARPDGVESTTGECEFDVAPGQLDEH